MVTAEVLLDALDEFHVTVFDASALDRIRQSGIAYLAPLELRQVEIELRKQTDIAIGVLTTANDKKDFLRRQGNLDGKKLLCVSLRVRFFQRLLLEHPEDRDYPSVQGRFLRKILVDEWNERIDADPETGLS